MGAVTKGNNNGKLIFGIISTLIVLGVSGYVYYEYQIVKAANANTVTPDQVLAMARANGIIQ